MNSCVARQRQTANAAIRLLFIDGDGLDSFQESRSGTDVDKMDTAGDNRMDYDSQSAAGTLTWGELYDDGDMMPAQWEIANGTDPDNSDADADRKLAALAAAMDELLKPYLA